MKRVMAGILAAAVVITFAGCRNVFRLGEDSKLRSALTDLAEQTKKAVRDFAEAANNGISKASLSVTYELIEFESDADLPGFSADTARFQRNKLSESEYFQYTSLSEEEKGIYRAVVSAIRSGKTTVKLSEYKADTKTILHMYRAVTTDHPEFFFLAKSFLYTVSSADKVDKLILLYTDGNLSDEYNKKGKLVKSADREKINKQISVFSKRMSELSGEVDTATDLWGIEKQLHDLVIDEVVYDDAAASEANNENAEETNAFDAYGAACEGKAVCEGYAKLFQNLCYRFGINCTTVSGMAGDGGHMWNAVKLNGKWTMIDVTWDDADEEDLRYYRYFNRTQKQMKEDHKVEEETLAVPECTSEEGAFSRRFAFSISALSSPPDNYMEVLDRLVTGNDRFVCLTVKGSEKEMTRYIGDRILNPSSEVQEYIGSNGYDIDFDGESYITDEYVYLILS